jgi:hypothetical protein
VTLGPRRQEIIPFSVDVPETATPGDHAGAVTVTLRSSVVSKSGQRVHLDQTTGSRVLIRISGALRPVLGIEDLKVQYDSRLNPLTPGEAKLTYVVRNVGNVDLGAQQSVYVSGLFGSKAKATRVGDVPLLLPGSSVREAALVDGVWPEFRETAHVKISLLYIPGAVQPRSGPFYGTVHFWAVPWVILAAAAVVITIVAILVLLRWRRKRESTLAGASDTPNPPTDPDCSHAESSSAETPVVMVSDSGGGELEQGRQEIVKR